MQVVSSTSEPDQAFEVAVPYQVKGRRLDTEGAIRTRSRAAAQAERWAPVSARVRIFALLADVLVEAVEGAPPRTSHTTPHPPASALLTQGPGDCACPGCTGHAGRTSFPHASLPYVFRKVFAVLPRVKKVDLQ